MNDRRLAAAVDQCVAAVRAGAELETVLRRHEASRPDLDSLVLTALQLRSTTLSFDAGSTRERVLAFAYETPNVSRRRAFAIAMPLPRRRSFTPRALVLAPVLATLVVAVTLALFLVLRPVSGTEAATVLTVLGGDVRIETAKGIVEARDGMKLRPGDRVVTGPGARAVLTFSDGSTVTLESDAIVRLVGVSSSDGRLLVELDQAQGSTWTFIPESIGAAEVHIQTPSARVETNEAAVQTTVRTGGTDVGAQNGSIAVESRESRVEVPGGFRSSVEQPGAVASPQPAAAPGRELTLRVEGDVLVYVRDPGGATVGTVAPGVPINQVANAWVERSAGVTVFHLPEPVGGQYQLTLGASTTPVTVTAQVANGAQQTVLASGAAQNVAVEVGSNNSVTLSANAPAPSSQPSKVVVPDRAADKANTITPPTSTPTLVPTKTATPVPTSTPRPLPTATPVPAKTPSVSPVEPVDRDNTSSREITSSSTKP